MKSSKLLRTAEALLHLKQCFDQKRDWSTTRRGTESCAAFKGLPALLAALFVVATFSACGGAHSIPNQPAAPTPATPLALSDIYVAPVSMPSIRVGSSLQFDVAASYSDPSGVFSNKDVTSSATWTTSDPLIATVEHGLITGTGIGTVVITATFGGKLDSTKAAVGLTPTIAISPASTMFALSAKQLQFSATATYSDGTTLDVTDFANWTSTPTGILSFYLYFPGDATFLKTGTTTITAAFDTGDIATKEITVLP